MQKDKIMLMRRFGVPEEIISKVICFNIYEDYYWGVEREDDGDELIVYCSVNRNDIYDGEDSTLSKKIVTREKLFFRDKKTEYTLVIEEYVNINVDNDIVYAVTSLVDSNCMYEDRE